MSDKTDNFKLLFRTGDVEYRAYQPLLLAETLVENATSAEAASERGFRRLFRYLAGHNSEHRQLELTSPLATSRDVENVSIGPMMKVRRSGRAWRVSMMLPRDLSLSSAPRPLDSRVYLHPVASRLTAVLPYAESPHDSGFAGKTERLSKAIDAAGLHATSEAVLNRNTEIFAAVAERQAEVQIDVDGLPGNAEWWSQQVEPELH